MRVERRRNPSASSNEPVPGTVDHAGRVARPHDATAPIMEGMKFRIVLEYDAEAEAFSAVCLELPGCASAGETEEEARRNIIEAIELYLTASEIELPGNAKLEEIIVT
jgi:predicted RNase H-like HicB family nuclease